MRAQIIADGKPEEILEGEVTHLVGFNALAMIQFRQGTFLFNLRDGKESYVAPSGEKGADQLTYYRLTEESRTELIAEWEKLSTK